MAERPIPRPFDPTPLCRLPRDGPHFLGFYARLFLPALIEPDRPRPYLDSDTSCSTHDPLLDNRHPRRQPDRRQIPQPYNPNLPPRGLESARQALGHAVVL